MAGRQTTAYALPRKARQPESWDPGRDTESTYRPNGTRC